MQTLNKLVQPFCQKTFRVLGWSHMHGHTGFKEMNVENVLILKCLTVSDTAFPTAFWHQNLGCWTSFVHFWDAQVVWKQEGFELPSQSLFFFTLLLQSLYMCNVMNAFKDRLSGSEHLYPLLNKSLCQNNKGTKDRASTREMREAVWCSHYAGRLFALPLTVAIQNTQRMHLCPYDWKRACTN